MPYYCELYLLREKLLFLWQVDQLNVKYTLPFTFFSNLALSALGSVMVQYPIPAWAYNLPRLLSSYKLVARLLANPVGFMKIMGLALFYHTLFWPMSHRSLSQDYEVKLNRLFAPPLPASFYSNQAFRNLLGRVVARYPELVSSEAILLSRETTSSAAGPGVKMSEVDQGVLELEQAMERIKN